MKKPEQIRSFDPELTRVLVTIDRYQRAAAMREWQSLIARPFTPRLVDNAVYAPSVTIAVVSDIVQRPAFANVETSHQVPTIHRTLP